MMGGSVGAAAHEARWTRIRGSFDPRVRTSMMVMLGVAAMTLAAHVRVPIGPVPFTLQSMVAVVMGGILGWRLAPISLLAYIAFGVLGVPVFAGGAGLGHVAGPTAGFLVGFVLAGLVVPKILHRARPRSLGILLAVVAGHTVIFVAGLSWLALSIGRLQEAVAVGLVPFLFSESLKIGLATAIIGAVGARSALTRSR